MDDSSLGVSGAHRPPRLFACLLCGRGAGVEVVRKVVAYALSRPCREVLFTVVSRREKYTAKVGRGRGWAGRGGGRGAVHGERRMEGVGQGGGGRGMGELERGKALSFRKRLLCVRTCHPPVCG